MIFAVFVSVAVQAQETSGSFTGGSIRIGNDSRSCDGTLEGAIRYNSGAMEFCNGSIWSSVGGGGGGGTFGKITMPAGAGCSFSTTSTSWYTFDTQDSSCGTQTASGDASVPSEGKIPAIRFATLPAGNYLVIANAYMSAGGADEGFRRCVFRIYDGSTGSGRTFAWHYDGSSPQYDQQVSSEILVGSFSYASEQTGHTFYIQSDADGTGSCRIALDSLLGNNHIFEMIVIPFG